MRCAVLDEKIHTEKAKGGFHLTGHTTNANGQPDGKNGKYEDGMKLMGAGYNKNQILYAYLM